MPPFYDYGLIRHVSLTLFVRNAKSLPPAPHQDKVIIMVRADGQLSTLGTIDADGAYNYQFDTDHWELDADFYSPLHIPPFSFSWVVTTLAEMP